MPRKQKSFEQLQRLNQKHYKIGAPYFYMHYYRKGFAYMTKLYKVPIGQLQLAYMFQHYQCKHFAYVSEASSNMPEPFTEIAVQNSIRDESAISEAKSALSAAGASESSFLGSLFDYLDTCGPREYFTQTQEVSTRFCGVGDYAEGLGSVRFSDFSREKLRIGDYIS